MRNLFLASLLCLISDLVFSKKSIERSEKVLETYTQCGISSDWAFSNWAKNIQTTTPTVFPKSDSELKKYLDIIKKNNCKVRPVGATHTAGGLVLDNNSSVNTIAVSLAFYEPDDKEWKTKVSQTKNGNSVRIPAGKSLLDLVSEIRPKNLFTPTQTAGFIFAIGGIVANSVHGGVYGKGYSNYYVTKMRVMLSDGQIKVIDDKEEIKYWRQSFGLLGIITAVEFDLEERNDFRMGMIDQVFSKQEFSREEFESAISKTRADKEIYGEFFFNAYTYSMSTITFKNKLGDSPKTDNDCSWSYPDVCCFPEAFCTYQYHFGDINLSQSCRIRKVEEYPEVYGHYKHDFPDISTKGDPTNIIPGDQYSNQISDLINKISKIPLLAHDGTICKILAMSTMFATGKLVGKAQKDSNDGYWVRTAPKANIMAYIFPADKLYDALKVYKDNVYALLEGTSPVSKYTTFKFNQPCEWRFITLNNELASKYQVPQEEGDFVVIEALNLNDDLDDFKWAFAQLEHEWLQIPGSKPHLGKIWGFNYNSISQGVRPEPFTVEAARSYLTEDQKKAFYEYQSKVDKDQLFFGGLATEFFK